MVSLNDINQEADNKYGPFVVDDVPGGEVVLRNAIRLTKDERDRLAQMDAAIKAASKSGNLNLVLEIVTNLFHLVAVGDGGKRLVESLEDDPTKLMVLLTLYREATQLGEASRSES